MIARTERNKKIEPEIDDLLEDPLQFAPDPLFYSNLEELPATQNEPRLLQKVLEITSSQDFWNDLSLVLRILEPINAVQKQSEGPSYTLRNVFSSWASIQEAWCRLPFDYLRLDSINRVKDALNIIFEERLQKQFTASHILAYHLTPERILSNQSPSPQHGDIINYELRYRTLTHDSYKKCYHQYIQFLA